MLYCVLLIRFVKLYRCFVRYNGVLCLVILFWNDVMLFYRLKWYGVSYYVIL